MSILKPNLTDQQTNLLSYIPNTLLSKYFRRNAAPTTIPASQHSRALILSTNILHFSNITQTYLKDQPNGLELIANLHKEFVELIQEYVKGTGADMLRYNTDRVMFYWEIPSIDTEECLDRLSNALVYKILQLKNVLKQRFIRQGAQVSFSFVFTEGSFTSFSLGNAKTTVDHVYGGHSVLEALECPRPDPDDVWIFVSQRIVERIQTDFVINALDLGAGGNENKAPFFLVTGVVENSRISSSSIEGVDIRKMVKPEQFDKIFKEVGSYIPKCLNAFIENGIDNWGNELRKVTTMFLNIPLDVQDIQSEQGLTNLQNIVTKVRKSVQEYNGFIYRFYLDSKGIYMFVLFGLYPDCHPEDSMKCMLCSLSINESLAKLGVAVYTGISTGEVLLSICGTYQKDLFIIGEPLYTAFLLSLVSLKDGSIRIMVDFESKVAAESKLSFQLYKNPIFTGKIAEGIFQIMYSGEPLPQTSGDDCPEIRTHRFNVDYSESNTTEEKVTSLFMTGRDTELQSAKRIFSQFIKAPTKPNVLLLVGSYGVGKSLFAKNLAESVHQILDKTPLTTDTRPEIFASSISPINKKKRLNGWRFFMRDILERLAFAANKSREEYLTSLFETEPDLKANIRLLKDILNLNLPQPTTSPTKTKTKKTTEEEEPVEETNSKALPPSEQALIIRALIVLLQKFVGEKEERKASSSLNKSTASAKTSTSPTKDPKATAPEEKANLPPIILCLDDLQEFDELSWDLLTKSVKKVQKIFIVAILRDDEVNKRSMRNIQTGLKDLGTNRALTLNKITLENLKSEDIGILTKRMLGNREPSDEIKHFVATRCEGNPLLVINMLDSLIKQGLLQEETGVVFPSEELSRLIDLGEYIEIKVPSPKKKVIGAMLDDLTMLHYNLLKIASAIGETFDLKSLIVTNPFHYRLIPYDVMLSLLQELTQGGIFQLVANRNGRNLVYKFKTPFTRETVYQRMSFAQRRRLHRALALNYENQSEKSPEEDQKLMYQWYLSELGGHKQKVDGSLLRKISALNSQPTRRGEVVIKTGDLEKKSVKTEHKWWPRFGALTQNALKYYRSEKDFNEKPVLEAGSIVLKGITMIDVRAFDILEGTGNNRMMTQKPGMFIHTEKYYKGQKPRERRDYSFVCESQEEAEDWVLCIEYMRNKAVYEDFLQTVDPNLLNVRVETMRESSPQNDSRAKFWSPSVEINQEIYHIKNSLTREGSPDKRSGVWQRSSSPFYDEDMGDDRYESSSLQNSGSLKKNRNKELVKTFLEKGQLSFWASLFNAPLKGSLKGRNFGKTPDMLRERQDLMKVDGDLLRSEPMRVSIVENEPRPRQLTFGVQNNEIERFRNVLEEEQSVVKKSSANNALFRGGRMQQSNNWSEKSFQTNGDNNESLNYARSVNSIGENSYREGQTVTKKEWKSNNPPERRSTRPGVGEISYRDDTYVEMVEEVVKSKLMRNSGFSSSRRNTDMRSDGKNTVRITFFPKSVRDLSKPNIYGRYQFFPTFFIDSVVDDKVFASKSNQVKDLTRARTTKVNIPNAGEMVFKLRYEDGQNVFVMNEESHERLKNSQQRTLASASRLEDEAPVYKPVIKQLQNFVWENYAKEKPSPMRAEPEEVQFSRTFDSPEVTKAHSRNNSSSYYGNNNNNNLTPTTQAIRNLTHIREYNPSQGSGSKLSPLDIYKNKVMSEMSRDSGNDAFPSFRGGFESSQRSLGEDSIRKFVEPYRSPSPGKPDLDDLKQHIENYNDTLTRVYGGNQPPSATIGGGGYNGGSGQKPANVRAYGVNTSPLGTSSPLDKYLIDQSRNYSGPSDTIKRSTSPINYGDIRPSPFKEPMTTSSNEMYRNYPSPIETYSSNKYNLPGETTYSMKQTTTTNVPPIQNFVTPSFTAIPSSINEDAKIHKASPASNERFSPSVVIKPLTGQIPSGDCKIIFINLISFSQVFCMGRIRRNTRSQDGDIFNLGPREMVIVTRVYDKRGLVELLWNGMTGLFPLDDVELLKLEDVNPEQARLAAMARGGNNRSQNNSGQDYYMSYESRSEIDSLPRFGGAGEESTIINNSSFNNSSMTGGSGMPSKMMQRQLRKMQKNNILDRVLDN